jgi:hypothetical protein
MGELMDQLDRLLELPIDEAFKMRDGVMEQMWKEEQQSWPLLMETFKEILSLEAKLRDRLDPDERDDISSRLAEMKNVFLAPSQPPSRSTSNPEKLNSPRDSTRILAEKELLLKQLEDEFQINHPISSMRIIRQERLSFFYTRGMFHLQFRDNLFGHLLEMRVAARRHQLYREIVNAASDVSIKNDSIIHSSLESLEDLQHRIQLAREISTSLSRRVNKLRAGLM